MAEDDDQKTEHPTGKRLQEAHDKGNLPFSREVGNFLMMAFIALLIGGIAPSIMTSTVSLLTPLITDFDSIETDEKSVGHLLYYYTLRSFGILAIPVLGVIAIALASRFMQSGFLLSWEPLIPKWSKISPMAGLKRLFSLRSTVELIKSIFKFVIIGTIAFLAVYPELTHIRQLPDSTVLVMLLLLGKLSLNMAMGVAIAMFFIALFDVLYQRYQFIKSLRMTKQEVKDEYKQMEGDPKVKQRLRRLRLERARKRMMDAVPKADVVITNPTHYAVALKYESKEMKAPTVIAKGQDLIALKIREVAEENKVPVVENPPLARALFTSTEIDQEIPLAHYEAVAKVISYVYQLKGKKF